MCVCATLDRPSATHLVSSSTGASRRCLILLLLLLQRTVGSQLFCYSLCLLSDQWICSFKLEYVEESMNYGALKTVWPTQPCCPCCCCRQFTTLWQNIRRIENLSEYKAKLQSATGKSKWPSPSEELHKACRHFARNMTVQQRCQPRRLMIKLWA